VVKVVASNKGRGVYFWLILKRIVWKSNWLILKKSVNFDGCNSGGLCKMHAVAT